MPQTACVDTGRSDATKTPLAGKGPGPGLTAARVAVAVILVGSAPGCTESAWAGDLDLSVYSSALAAPLGPIGGGLPQDDPHSRAMECLTQAVYYEAASEPLAGQQAVAQVVLNRVKHPAFPKSVCGVVYEGSSRSTGCQFTFTCDGSLLRRPSASKWAQAQAVAADALAGRIGDEVGASTHYHASWMTPYWQSSMVETARIGGHVFYQSPGPRAWRTGGALVYEGLEPVQPAATLARMAAPGSRRSHRGRGPDVASRSSQPSSFSVWGLRVATITPLGKDLVVRDGQ